MIFTYSNRFLHEFRITGIITNRKRRNTKKSLSFLVLTQATKNETKQIIKKYLYFHINVKQIIKAC